MGSNTNHTPTVGLVTQTDDRYIYVWNERYGKDELRFPKKSIPEVEPGDIVRFLQRQDVRGVQYQMDIQPERNAYLYVEKMRNNNVPFKVRTWFAFAPSYYEPYECHDNMKVRVVMAYSLEFGRIACFLSKVEFKPNIVYEGSICRIPKNNNFIVDYVETVFCLMKGFEECKDEAMVKEVLSKVPWRNCKNPNVIFQIHNDGIDEDFEQEEVIGLKPGSGLVSVIDDDFKKLPLSDNNSFLPLSSKTSFYNTNETTFNSFQGINRSNDLLMRDSVLRQKDDFGGKSSFSAVDSFSKSADVQPFLYEGGQFNNNSRRTMNRSASGRVGVPNAVDQTGIVVRLEKSYAVVWSTNNELACASELSASTMPLGTWVRFLCFDDTVEGGNIKKSVYRIEEIQPPRLSYKLGHTVKVQAFVTLVESKCHNEYFVFAQDKVLGIVLCGRDQWLVSNLRAGKEVEIFTVYVEDYQKPSRWFAIGVNRGNNDWKKMDRLPQRVNDLAEEAFNIRCSKDEDDTYNGPPPQELSVQKFCTPQNWSGPLHVTDKKIRDVLGIVVAYESKNLISVLYTTFGLVRVPMSLLIGQWMRVTIVEETDLDGQYENTSALTDRCYAVQAGEKIMPPMSTRVVVYNNAEKILLCCVITRGSTCLENNILGRIWDTKERMPIDRVPYFNGYLAELMLARRKDSGFFWNVAKYHGIAQQGVNQVPLALSCYPDEVGRTCDDPHSVMVDPSYSSDAKEAVSEVIRNQTVPTGADIYRQDSSSARRAYDDVSIDSIAFTRERSSSGSGDADMKQGETAAQWLFVNDKANVVDELRRYKPAVGGTKGRGACLVVRKMDSFAVAYSKKFGLILIKPNAFVNKSEYGKVCKPSVWIYATIVPVIYDDDTSEKIASQSLPYKYIAVPEIKQMGDSSFLPTRVFNDFVQVEVPCKFNEETIRRVVDEPTKLITTTPLGDVLFSELMYKKLELHDKETTLWVTHIREKHGCFWKLVLNDLLRGCDSDDDCVSASKIGVDSLLRCRRSSSLQQQDLFLFEEPQQLPPLPPISGAEAEAIFGPGFDVNSLAKMGLLSMCALQPAATSNNSLLLAQLAAEELRLRNKEEKSGENSKNVRPIEDKADENSANANGSSEQSGENPPAPSVSLESGLTTLSSFSLVDTVGGSSTATVDVGSVRSSSAIPLSYEPLNVGDDVHRKSSSSINLGGSSSFCEIGHLRNRHNNNGDGSDGSAKTACGMELRLHSSSTSVNSFSCGDEEKKRSGSEDADNEEENIDECRRIGLPSSSFIVERKSTGGGDSSSRQPRRHHRRATRIDYGDACIEKFSDTEEDSTSGDDKMVYCGRESIDDDDDSLLQICAIEENEPLWEEAERYDTGGGDDFSYTKNERELLEKERNVVAERTILSNKAALDGIETHR